MPVSDQGISADRYTFIPRTLIFLRSGGCLLLIRGAPHKRLWANRYNGIGGHIEPGEDILHAAQRELAEETGLTIDQLQLRAVVSIDVKPERGVLIFVFYGENPRGELLSSDEGQLEWVEIERLNTLPLVEDLPILLPRILTRQTGEPPFFAHYSYDRQGKLNIRFA